MTYGLGNEGHLLLALIQRRSWSRLVARKGVEGMYMTATHQYILVDWMLLYSRRRTKDLEYKMVDCEDLVAEMMARGIFGRMDLHP